MIVNRWMFAMAWLGLLVQPGRGDDSIDYARQIKPILRERCYSCHGSLKQESGLRLDTVALMKRGGRSGPVIQPGDPAGSELIQRVTHEDEAERMPRDGKPLAPEQIAALRNWIQVGAGAAADERPEEDPLEHWSFRPLVRPSLPAVKDREWARNPIDAFVGAEHEKRGLRPLPQADKQVLLRRVYLDLIGIPPTRRQLQAFMADDSQQAYERVVEELLASPQHGERWGRHWMDVWRYSDWYGRRSTPDVLNSYARVWRWRDWIVRSINEDRGYDWMVRQMLAADELSPEDDENLVATGFIVRNWYRWNYNTWMKEIVEHTGKAFLGLTFNCAQCHDHKYDPISQREYFAFRAFFEPLELRHDRWPGEPDPGPFPKYVYGAAYAPIKSGAVRVFDQKLDAQTFMYSGGEERNIIPDKPPIHPAGPAFLGGERLVIQPVELPARAWYPGLKGFVVYEEVSLKEAALAAAATDLERAEQEWSAVESRVAAAKPSVEGADVIEKADDGAATALKIARLAVASQQARHAAAAAELASVKARIAADRARYEPEPSVPAESIAQLIGQAVLGERQWQVASAQAQLASARHALAAATVRPATDDKRQPAIDAAQKQYDAAEKAMETAQASAANPGDDYTPLSPKYPNKSTGRRLALAQWITDSRNPLTARVAVNHIWNRHFGQALVETTYDLGRNGKRPNHPELLDWLAAELIDGGWRIKPLHRWIVTSSAYRMRSDVVAADDPNWALDPDNRWLWRFPTQRMAAEVVRDSVLATVGELDLAVGGEELDHELGLANRRRSLYFAHHAESRMQFLEMFDPANACDAYTRTVSIMPQQALAMSNSQLTVEQSRRLARQLWSQLEPPSGATQSEEGAFVAAAFEQVLTREPSADELSASLRFLLRQRELFEKVAPAPATGAADPSAPGPSPDPAMRARENLVQVLYNHNDFVTIR